MSGILDEFLPLLKERFTEHLHMRLEEVGPERTVLSMDWRRELTMPFGSLHGGAMASLADSAAGVAMAASLQKGQAFTTVEMKLNLIRAVREGTVTAVATPLHRGRRTAVYEVRMKDDSDRLVGIFVCTQLILAEQT